MSENLPFSTINEFSIQALLHEGPYTLVYRGYQTNLKRPVLIKLLKPGSSVELKKRFEREARVYARLSHPNIAAVYALGEKEKYLYIIQEFIDGISLRALLNAKQKLEFGQVWYILDAVLQALEHAAALNVVHRDIKPENILIDRQGRVKTADFGLALITDEPGLTVQQTLLGTPAYMSPEQITGEKLSGQSDLFSLSAVLYEMVFGEKAFAGDGYAESINKILNDEPEFLQNPPDQLDSKILEFLKRGLKKQASQRWPDVPSACQEWNTQKPPESESAKKQLTQNIAGINDSEKVKTAETDVPDKNKKKSIVPVYILVFVVVMVSVIWYAGRDFNESQISVPQALVDSINNTKPNNLVADDKNEQQADTTIQRVITVPVKNNSVQSVMENKENADALPEGEKTPAPEKLVLAELDLVVSPWARVYINQSLVDTHLVNRHFSLPVGHYNLRFEHPRFSPENQQVNLAAGELTQVAWSFWQQTGFLKLEVRPWAHVYINDEFYDTTPLPDLLRVPAGSKILELRHPDLKNHRERIVITAGDTLNLKISLQH